MNGWQSMDSAPMDGHLFLAWLPTERSALVAWMIRPYGSSHWHEPGMGGCQPTHWQPLPAPPRAEALAAPMEKGHWFCTACCHIVTNIGSDTTAQLFHFNPVDSRCGPVVWRAEALAPHPQTAQPCANGHVWSNDYGDDWTPENDARCDCGKKGWGERVREIRLHTPEFDNHHNALLCPYCNPQKLVLRAAALDAAPSSPARCDALTPGNQVSDGGRCVLDAGHAGDHALAAPEAE
jgi:hypothetical protein